MPLTQVSSRLIEDTLRYVLGANGSSDYTFTGPGLSGTVNDPTLTLSRGHTYIFENRNSSGAHPFYIKTSLAGGGTNNAYNTGVTNNGGAGGTEIIFTVPHDAPNLLYYQCSSHSNMNGQLKIADALVAGTLPTGVQVLTTNISSGQLVTGHIAAGTGFQVDTNNIVDDAVTEDKLANSINSAIAANTAKDLTALSASNLTSGTIPDARFPATLPAVSGANLTGIGGGITMIDHWRLHTTYNVPHNSTTIISTANWERPDSSNDGFAQLGTGMSVNSSDHAAGIWTFPSTGFYSVSFGGMIQNQNNDAYEVFVRLEATENNSSFGEQTRVYLSGERYNYQGNFGQAIIDVTDTSQVKLRLRVYSASSDTDLKGNSGRSETYLVIMRLGDT